VHLVRGGSFIQHNVRMTAEALTLDVLHINYAALTEPITKDQVRLFRAETRAAQRADPSIATGLTTATSAISIVAIFVAILFIGSIFVGMVAAITVTTDGGPDLGGIAVSVVIVLIFTGITVAVLRSAFGIHGHWAKWMRLSQFSAANGLRFGSRSSSPSYPGCVFQSGDSRFVFDHFATTSGRFLDFGNYQYSTGSEKSRQVHRWGFLALQLDRQLPNMVLDSKANNGLFGGTNLPQTFKRDQVLSLEGDFDRYFTLYCPQEYEQDALYVFTPDLMALLIDDAAPFDVEIVDNWMFIYSAQPFAELEVLTYERLFNIVRTVGTKTVTQTEEYHDDRVGSAAANIVAPQGQRLRHGTSIGALVFVAALAGFWIWNTFGQFLQ
jgi:hypothetical protein